MQTTTNNPTIADKRIPAGKVAFGLALLFIGIISFTDAIDVWEPGEIWRLWPLLPIVVGVATEADALRARRDDSGYLILGFGVWMLAANQQFMDLNYVSAMPLGIAVAGLGLVVHALVDLPATKKESDDDQH
jgi:hypothetical protein